MRQTGPGFIFQPREQAQDHKQSNGRECMQQYSAVNDATIEPPASISIEHENERNRKCR